MDNNTIIERLKKDDIKFKWVIVGGGLDILKPAICAKNLQDNIILVPHIGVKDDSKKINQSISSRML